MDCEIPRSVREENKVLVCKSLLHFKIESDTGQCTSEDADGDRIM